MRQLAHSRVSPEPSHERRPATGWESGRHVSIKGLADPDRALARSLRRGQPSSGRACFHGRPIPSTGIRCLP